MDLQPRLAAVGLVAPRHFADEGLFSRVDDLVSRQVSLGNELFAAIGVITRKRPLFRMASEVRLEVSRLREGLFAVEKRAEQQCLYTSRMLNEFKIWETS